MIITLTGADFSSKNIGTLDTWMIFTSLGTGVTASETISSVDRDAAYTNTFTLGTDYEVGSAGVTVTMGGTTLTDVTTISDKTITISISAVTGTVYISIPTVNTATGEESGGTEDSDDTTITELNFTTSGFYNNSNNGGGITSPNSSWYMSDLIPIDTLANNSDGYCTTSLQGHSKVAVVYYASSNSTDASAFLGNYGTTTQGEVVQYTAEEVKSNAPSGTTYVGFSTHVSQLPFNVYVIA